MNVAYRGPDPSLVALTNELRAHYGQPARTYEYVTGYKAADNFSGHNPDSNGIVHAVDIFTDDHGNIPQPEGRALADRLRLVGKATNRFSYLIHDMSAGAPQPMIAGQFNGWAWQAYNGADMHSDHIHVSIADLYWGDPCPVPASVYNNTARWNVTGAATTKPQSGTITPIPAQKDWFDTMTPAEKKALLDAAAKINRYADTKISDVAGKILDVKIKRGGGVAGETTLRSTVAWLDANLAGIREGMDPKAIADAIPEDLAQQVIAALSAKLAK